MHYFGLMMGIEDPLMVLLIDVIEHEIANEIQKTSNNLQRNY
jgi:hypothetical protein